VVIAQFYPFEQGPSPHTVLTSYRRNGSSTSGASFGNFTIFAGAILSAIGPMNFGRRGGFASLCSIALPDCDIAAGSGRCSAGEVQRWLDLIRLSGLRTGLSGAPDVPM